MGHENVARLLNNKGGILQDAQKGCQQGHSERRAEAYPLWYVEGLNDARTLHGKRRVSARRGRAGEKSDFFSILQARGR